MEGSSICCVFTDIYVYMEQVTAMVKKVFNDYPSSG